MKLLFKVVLICIISNYAYSQKEDSYEQFTVEYDLGRFIEVSQVKKMDNWKEIKTKIHFNKNFGGHIKIEAEDGWVLELFQITPIEERVDSETNREFLLTLCEDEEKNQYELLFYLDEDKSTIIYMNTGEEFTHVYQFIRRKYYEKKDTP
jgi:hypothetical protein